MFCITCKNKTCLETQKPCQELENYFERQNSKRGYSLRHIRRREKPHDPRELSGLNRAFLQRILGHKNIKINPEIP
jgi:predicted NBD/HSP70 family sugar kinase